MEMKFEPRRELGKTGFVATVLGVGDVADKNVPLEQCVSTVRRAMDAGLNVIDTAPSYEDGYSEAIVGSALKGRRDSMFVIDKIDNHDDPVGPQVDASLKRLDLEMVDLFAMHGLSSIEGWAKATAFGGAFDELEKCRRAGKLRFRGISSHDPETLILAINSGLCDVVLFAVGAYVDERFVSEVLPLAKKKNVGTVCFKTFGAGKLLCDTAGYGRPLEQRPRGKFSSGGQEKTGKNVLPCMSVEECVHYTLTCDPDVALLGMSFENEQRAAFESAKNFKPLTAEQMADIRRRAKEAVAEKGPCWWNPK